MRTTLTLDDDIFAAAKELAAHDRKTVGEVVSDLVRKGLKPSGEAPRYRNGIRLMPVSPGAGIVTLELVNSLRDEEE
jgi:hypothetical protein